MAQVAHRIEAPLRPEQYHNYAISSRVDEDLSKRIRSLLVAHNGHHTPKAPCPSPDFSYFGHDSVENRSSYSSISPLHEDLGVAKTIAKLMLLESREPVVVASRYDGPAGQVEGLNNDYHSNQPSQPDVDQDASVRREETKNSNEPSGLNFLTDVDQIGRLNRRSDSSATLSTVGSPSRPMSISSKRSTASRAPVFNLRTVPLHTSRQAEVPFKPKLQHVPGSFETEGSTAEGFMTPSSRLTDGSTPESRVAELPQPYLESKPERRSRAVEALTNVRGHDALDNALHSKPLLRKEPSVSTLGSTTSTLPSHHPPSKIFAAQSNLGEAAEPIMTPGIGEGRSYSKVLEPLPRLGEDKRKKDGKPQLGSSGVDDESTKVEDADSSFVTRSPSDSPLPELPAHLPPVTEKNLRELEDGYRAEKLAGGSESHALTRQATAIYSPKAADSLFVNPSASFSEGNDFSDQKATFPAPDAENVLGRDGNTSSLTARKLSSLSSVISESISSIRAGLQMPPVGTSAQHEKDNGVDEASRMQKPASLPSLRNSQSSLDNADNVRLLKQSKTAGHTEPQPRKHWIRALLTPRSAAALSPTQNQAILTERPSRRTGFATNVERSQSLEKTPVETVRSALNEPKTLSDTLGVEGADEKSIEFQKQQSTVSFTGVIQDLEVLLKEALLIAKQATDPNVDKGGPLSPRYPLSKNISLDSIDSIDGVSSSGGLDEEEHYTTLPQQQIDHSRDHINAVTSDKHFSPVEHFVQNPNAAVYPGRSVAPTRHQSTVTEPKTADTDLEGVKGQDRSTTDSDFMPEHPAPELSGTIPEFIDDSVRTKPNENPFPHCHALDWAYVKQSSQTGELKPLRKTPSMPRQPESLQTPLKERQDIVLRDNKPCPSISPGKGAHVNNNARKRPLIQPRSSSAGLRLTKIYSTPNKFSRLQSSVEEDEGDIHMTVLQPSGAQYRSDTQNAVTSRPSREPSFSPSMIQHREDEISPLQRPDDDSGLQGQSSSSKRYSLKNRRHFSLREGHGFSLSRSHRRAPIARDWSNSRKRYVATVTCISTALLGLIIGIYAGEVPAIQYTIVDEHHYTILGNVGLFIGLAISTGLFWPLPILHGRKPYTLAALAILLPLQFPQGLSVNAARSPYVATYRVGLLLSRAISGFIMGFANVNFKTTLLDLFGASLQSSNPHQETVSSNDVRRHGGGMGVWLGIWTWCSIGSVGLGFLVGALIISGLEVAWGFWITMILTACTLILNVLVPEVRRSAYRRSMAEVRNGRIVSRRIAKGEIKMHIDSTGPMWWGEEVAAGYRLCLRMLKQPGFIVLSLYVAWIYGQIVMLIVVSHDQIFNALMAYSGPALGGANVQVLPLSSTVRGTLRGCDSFRCLTCHPFPEGIPL